jgi:hypothetical protein
MYFKRNIMVDATKVVFFISEKITVYTVYAHPPTFKKRSEID